MKRRIKKQAIAILMTVMMVVGLVPANFVGGVSKVKAEGKEWLFGTKNVPEESQVKYEGTTGEYDGLTIDATAGKFDLSNNTDWAQFNTGAKVSFDVAGPTKVTVNGYNAGGYAVDGTACDADAKTDFVYYYTESAAKTIVIEATANTYLAYIKIEDYTPPAAGKEWLFGTKNVPAESQIKYQGTTGEYDGLTIDATAGKFDLSNNTDWAQFNTGAKVSFDVAGPTKVTVKGYSAGGYTVDGTACDADAQTDFEYYYDGLAAKTIVIEATANTYLAYIKTEDYDPPVSGNAESFTFVMDEKAEGGVVKTGEYKFGDSTLLLAGETVDGKITQYTVKKIRKL